MPKNIKKIIIPLAVFIFSGVIYLKTLCPTISWIDSGELATVCYTLGIAHPTGYPLYTLLGKLFSFLPFGEPIFRFNLMSAFWVSLTNLCLFLSLILISDIFFSKELKTGLKLSAAVLITILFSFSRILWSQALINEVYSLNIFLCSLIILTALYWHKTNLNPNNSNTAISPLVYLLAYLVGLSSGNHLLGLLLLPTLLFLLVFSVNRKFYRLKSLILIFCFLTLGVSIYLYLPVRASLNPVLNFGNPSTWLNFKNHLSAKIYQKWMFGEEEVVFWKNLSHFFFTFLKQFPVWSFPLMILGVFKAFRQNLKLALFFLLIIFINLLWSLNYNIKDINSYFLQTFLTSSFLLYLGFLYFLDIFQKVLSWLKSTDRLRSILGFAVILILGILYLIRFPQEFESQDRSKNYIPYDFTSNLLRSSHKKALVLTEIWDFYSPWLYLRFVENKRPDFEMLNTIFLKRSWYKNHLLEYYPDIYERSSGEINIYNQVLISVEKNQSSSSSEVSGAYTQMINSIIFKNFMDRPVYVTFLDAQKGYSGLPIITEGLLMRFRKEKIFYPYEFPEFKLRGIPEPEIPKTSKDFSSIAYYAVSYYNRALYLKFFKLDEEAKRYVQQAYYFKRVWLNQQPGLKFGYF